MSQSLDRGTVVRVRLDPTQGSEIRKTRPAVVVSNRAACRFDSVVQVVPATGLPERDLRPFESYAASAASGVTKASRLMTNQIRTVSKERIEAVLGRLEPHEAESLDTALRIQLGLGDGTASGKR